MSLLARRFGKAPGAVYVLRGSMLTRRTLISSAAMIGAASSVIPASAAFTASPAPQLAGSWYAPKDHPSIFLTADEADCLLDFRDQSIGQATSNLEARCRSVVRNPSRFTTPFDGCTLDTYLHKLTYEHGTATVAAADLATYSYLASRHRGFGDPTLVEQAEGIAKQILANWSTGGFRDGGSFRSQLSRYCDEKGQSNDGVSFGIGLQLGRGMPNWVHAQDLLLAVGAIDQSEQARLSGFLGDVYALIKSAANYRARQSNLDCNRFSNHVSVQLAAMIAIGCLRRDRLEVEEAAYGAGGDILIPWTLQLEKTIYGQDAKALNCFQNDKPAEFFQLALPLQGEIVDRYRAHEAQTFGYPMFSLLHLMLSATALRHVGYRPYGALAGKPNKMRSALNYYGGYFSALLSDNLTKVPADFGYPGRDQYINKIISGRDGVTITGADELLLPYLFALTAYPEDNVVAKVVKRARSFAPKYQAFGSVGSLYIGQLASFAS